MSDGQPTGPIRVDDLPWENWAEGIRFGGRARRVGSAAGGSRIGVLVEELPAGKQSSPLHWHTSEEEHVWFLAGHATLRLGDERHRVAAGDYVCFPAGRPLGHCIVNDSDDVCRYLVIGANVPDDVCLYPDSKKVYVRGASRLIVSSEPVRDYWDGEDVDRPPS